MSAKLFCDVCGKEIVLKDVRHLRLYDAFGPRQHYLHRMDICVDCIEDIMHFVHGMRGDDEGTGD